MFAQIPDNVISSTRFLNAALNKMADLRDFMHDESPIVSVSTTFLKRRNQDRLFRKLTDVAPTLARATCSTTQIPQHAAHASAHTCSRWVLETARGCFRETTDV